jgi:hypothetical protein
MSNIGDYQALVAAISVSFTDQSGKAQTITAKDAKDLKNVVQASGTPVRLLLPFAVGSGENISAELLEPDDTFGPNVYIRWTFSDVMLWRPSAFGEGLGDSAYDLREYVTAYMTAAYAMEPTGITDRMTVENTTVRIDEAINFPADGQDYFIGAIATWTVTEDDPP